MIRTIDTVSYPHSNQPIDEYQTNRYSAYVISNRQIDTDKVIINLSISTKGGRQEALL